MDDKNDIYNLPLASFTFGREVPKSLLQKGNSNSYKTTMQEKFINNYDKDKNSLKKKNIIQANQIENNYYFDNYTPKNTNSNKDEICELTFGTNTEIIKDEYVPNKYNNNNNAKKIKILYQHLLIMEE